MPHLRLFVAADLPAVLLADVAAEQARLKPAYRSLRWLDTAGMHLTLKFLGAVPEERVGEAAAITAAIAKQTAPCVAETTPVDAFPGWRSPRVVVLGCSVPAALAELHAKLEPAYANLGIAAETRAFRPHVTLARAREQRPKRLDPPLRAFPPHQFHIDQIVLYQSFLGAGGSKYQALGRWTLGS